MKCKENNRKDAELFENKENSTLFLLKEKIEILSTKTENNIEKIDLLDASYKELLKKSLSISCDHEESKLLKLGCFFLAGVFSSIFFSIIFYGFIC